MDPAAAMSCIKDAARNRRRDGREEEGTGDGLSDAATLAEASWRLSHTATAARVWHPPWWGEQEGGGAREA